MSASYNPHIELAVARGSGLHLTINGQRVKDAYGAIVMAELALLCEFPPLRVDAAIQYPGTPTAAAAARWIADELARNEIWD
jgi:hypothetical protein